MGPIRTLKILKRAQKVLSLFERASTDWDTRKARGDDMSKALWKSKTFWFNILTAGAELTQVLPLPAGTLTIVASVINIGLRLLTDKPVHVIPQE